MLLFSINIYLNNCYLIKCNKQQEKYRVSSEKIVHRIFNNRGCWHQQRVRLRERLQAVLVLEVVFSAFYDNDDTEFEFIENKIMGFRMTEGVFT